MNSELMDKIGSLLPVEGTRPKFIQLYIYDTENEIRNRIQAITGGQGQEALQPDIIDGLICMLDEYNPLVRTFRVARDRFDESTILTVSIRLIGSRETDGRSYNLPTASEVAAVIVGDFNMENTERDIIVDRRIGGLQRISELHPSFMAMQYPLLFPYGEDGFRLGIKKRTANGEYASRDCITMREFYAYRLQQRSNEGQTLLRGGRLF